MAWKARIGTLLAAPALMAGIAVASAPAATAASAAPTVVTGSCSSLYSDGGTITATCSRGTTVSWHCNMAAAGSVGRFYFSSYYCATWKTGCHLGTAWIRY